MLDAIVPDNRATRSKFRVSEEIADVLKRSTILQSETHQAGDNVVETDQFRRTVRALQAKKNFTRLLIVMDADVERALSRDFDFLREVMTAVGEGKTGTHEAPLSSTLTMLVPTWCQTTLIHADLRAPIMTTPPALIRLMAQHGCPQVGYPLDSSSRFGCYGVITHEYKESQRCPPL